MAASRTQPRSQALATDADNSSTHSPKPKSGKAKGKVKETVSSATNAPPAGPVPVSVQEIQRENAVEVEDEPWVWTTLADSSVSNRPALFTTDGNYFFSVVGSSVRIYSAGTGKVVSTLSSSSSASGSSGSRIIPNGDGHTDSITSVVLNPSNAYQLLTASLDGNIKVWDYLEATLLQTISIGRPISHMCAHASFEGQVFIATLTKTELKGNALMNQEKGNTLIYRVSLNPSSTAADIGAGAPRPASILRVGKTRAAVSLAISHNGAWLVAIAGYKAYVAMTSSLESGFTKFVSPEKLTCLAFHPSDEYFATGDEKGQIRLWYCLNDRLSFNASAATGSNVVERRAQTTTMHWHAHAVASVAFTANGAYLVSGGEESVLVIWQIHSGKKEFVPRLGSPVKSIAIRQGTEEEYLLGLADGSYMFVGASSLSVKRSISRVRLDNAKMLAARSAIPFAFHELSKTLVLPASHPSSLQVFSPSTSTLDSEIEVSPSNRVSKRDEKAIEPFQVERIAMSPDNQWMATLDKRENDEDFSAEVYLKIWRWVSVSSSWILNTRIDRPHGAHAVSVMSFSPDKDSSTGILLMTAGSDGCVKTWRIRTVTSKNGSTDDYWVNRSSFSFRSKMPLDACWSADGSVLAVSFGPHTTLFDPVSSSLLDCLDTSEVQNPDRVRFVGQSGRYLLVLNNRDLVLWDLVSRSVRWYYRSPSYVIHAIAHPRREVIALLLHPYAEAGATRRTTVITLGTSSAVPLTIKSMPFRLRSLIWQSETSDDLTLFGITESWNIVLFGEKASSHGELDTAGRRIDKNADASLSRTLFSDIFGASAVMESFATPAPPVVPTVEGQGGMQALLTLSGPAYLSPPVDSLYSSLMESFLPRVNEGTVNIAHAEDEPGDDEMVIDTEMAVIPSSYSRTVDDREVEMLSTLFRSQTIQHNPTARPVSNGKANGKYNSAQNGHPATPKGSSLLNGSAPAIAPPSASPQSNNQPPADTSPVVVGKKRKKT